MGLDILNSVCFKKKQPAFVIIQVPVVSWLVPQQETTCTKEIRHVVWELKKKMLIFFKYFFIPMQFLLCKDPGRVELFMFCFGLPLTFSQENVPPLFSQVRISTHF